MFESRILLCTTLLIQLTTFFVNGRGAGECATLCNDLRFEVLTLEICREAKRTLPRPKVGDFCSTAMEQGFSDACVALCMEQQPVARVAQTCRAAAIEMPRPTVRRWCEHGYNTAFRKTMEDLRTHFVVVQQQRQEQEFEPALEEAMESSFPNGGSNSNQFQSESVPSIYTDGEAERKIVARIPVTLENDETRTLFVHEGQDAEEAVVAFCREYLPSEVSTCIRHLLDSVMESLAHSQENAQD
jgi:hypothetical protein